MRRTVVYGGVLLGLGIAELGAYGTTGGVINTYVHVIRRADVRSTLPGVDQHVLYAGDRAEVTVAVQFPQDAYAFAAADLEVHSELAGWSDVSDGIVEGGNVLDILAGQSHDPQRGVVADPSNPLPIWSGEYAPECTEPRLVWISALANSFSYYPSELTGFSIESPASHVAYALLIDPIEVGDVALVAPAEGTTIDVLDEETFVAGGEATEIIIGLLVPAVQKVRVHPEFPLSALTLDTAVHVQRSMVTSLRVTFSEAANPMGYDLQPDWPLADAYEYVITLPGQTVRLRFRVGTDEAALAVGGMPDVFSTRVRADRATNSSRAIARLEYDETVGVLLPDGRRVVASSIEVHAVQNNLKQLTLGCHHVNAQGSGSMRFLLSDGSVSGVR